MNTFEEDAIAAIFADDAIIDDGHPRALGRPIAIRRQVAKEMVGDKVTRELAEAIGR